MSLHSDNSHNPRTNFHFTANWITCARVLLVIPMVWYYLHGDLLHGGVFFILSIVPDWFDGPFARWQSRRYNLTLSMDQEATLTFWQRMNFRGQTQLGALLDPLFDKVTNGLGLLLAGYGFVPYWLVFVIIGIDLVLQFVVRPFKQYHNIGSIKATDWGKYKTQCQGWCAGFMPFWDYFDWPYANVVFPVWLMACIGFGLMSLRSHLIPIWGWYQQRQ